jgi:signal transduction histidine kinase/ligand-binding sensor domain-containing protein/DNA-binding response OmpR family regulator
MLALAIVSAAGYSSGAVVTLPVTDGHDIQFVNLSVAGEPFHSAVRSIAQDRYGFMWFATNDGLYRYDGYNLKPYRHERGNPNSLSDDSVLVVYRDSAGILWVGTGFGGLDRLDPASETFTHYRHDPGSRRSLSDNAVYCIYQDMGGALWAGTSVGLDRLDPASGTFTHYVHNPQDSGSLSGNLVFHIFEDRLGNLWAGTVGGGINRLDRRTGRFSRFQDPNNPRRPGDDTSDLALTLISEDHSGVLWVGNALDTLDPKTGSLTRYAFRSKEPGGEIVTNVRAIQEDRDGVLWLGSQNGLIALDHERKQFVRYIKNPGNPHSLQDDDILSLFEDAEGNIWVGTQSGLSRFNPRPRFINLQHEIGNTQSLVDNNIRAVQMDSQGALWVGTRRGLQRVELKTGRFTLYQHDPHNPQSLSNNFITGILEDRSGILWVGTGGGGLDRLDRTTGRFFAYRYDPNNPSGLSSDGVQSLFEDRDGLLWVSTAAGLNRFDRRTGRFTQYHHDPQNPHSLSDDWIKTVFEDRAGILWVGCAEGLNRFDRASQQFNTYRHNPQDPASLSHDKVNDIWEDRRGTLWVATQDGLDQMDRGRGTFVTFTRRDGLPDNAVEAILEDDHGTLWLATHNGLSQFSPSTRTFHNYSESDGLAGNALNPTGLQGSYRAPDGEFFFGSRNGLTSFYPDRISANPYVPPVVLTDLLLFNKPVRPGGNSPLRRPILALDSLTLNHRQGIFTLEFAALSFQAPEKNRYRYRLDPLEKDWNQVDSRQRLATYTTLAPGKYLFRVQASNNGDVWNEQGVTLPIIILPPWWATWWARSGAVLVIVGLLIAAHKYRVRMLKLMATRLEAQVSQRTRELSVAKDAAEAANRAKSVFLANMSHELRTPLNAILGFSHLLREESVTAKQREELDLINLSGEHLLHLIDDVIDMAKIDTGRKALEIAPCHLGNLLRDVLDMIRAQAEKKGLELRLVSSPEFPQHVLIDASNLGQVLINLLGNAIKYTERGSVTLRLNATPADESQRLLLTFDVDDTGRGIAPEDQERIFEVFVQGGQPATQKGSGLGLAITRQIVKLMGGTIQVDSALGQGSRFRVEVPAELVQESEVIAPRVDTGRIIGLEPGQPEYRVLVVEDEQGNSMVLERILESAGFLVRVAADGAQGVEVFQTWRPHFIWMDHRMPVMDGVEATRRIRALEGGRDVKIAAVTASVFADQRSQILAAGMDDLVTKPYRPGEVFDCMARHLRVRYRRRETAPALREGIALLHREDFAALPEELRDELANSLISLDRERIAQVIQRVSAQSAPLGEVLMRHADRFAYTQMLDAVKNGP